MEAAEEQSDEAEQDSSFANSQKKTRGSLRVSNAESFD